MTRTILSLATFALVTGTGWADDANEIALKARSVFKQHCHRCHSGAGSEGGEFDVFDIKTLTASRDGDKPYVTPSKPDLSYLLERLDKGSMPPKAIKQRPTDEEKKAVREWIAAGAPAFPTDRHRQRLTQLSSLTAVRDHLRHATPEARPFLRYFTMYHLHNNAKSPTSDLAVTRAALSKAINSMHWRPRIVMPQEVEGSQGTIYVIDLRDVDWDKQKIWGEVEKAYPYGLRYDQGSDEKLRTVDIEIARLTGLASGDPLPIIRADWFVSSVTRPPLYHTMLQIPKTATALEKMLKVDVADNFQRDQLMRAGFASSGVSGQNRLLERHEAAYGAYWKSYDFLPNRTGSNLLQFPLGPKFKDNKFEDTAFVHDGGEIIFHLPNRLQAYMLVDGKDNRIDEGPISVVSDSLKTSGTPAIVNGLSCMACHKHGMIGFKDQIREGAGVFDAAKLKVKQLYPEAKSIDERVKEDEDMFMKALEKAVGPFLKIGGDANKSIRELTADEPVAAVARLYRLVDLDLVSAACELDIDNPEMLKGMIMGNRRLQEIGLGPLAKDGGKVKRHDWEKARLRSTYQLAAQELGKGTPVTRIK